jgi:hypothetical protein
MRKFNFYISEDGRKFFTIEIFAKDRDEAIYLARKRYPDRSVKVIYMGVKLSD